MTDSQARARRGLTGPPKIVIAAVILVVVVAGLYWWVDDPGNSVSESGGSGRTYTCEEWQEEILHIRRTVPENIAVKTMGSRPENCPVPKRLK